MRFVFLSLIVLSLFSGLVFAHEDNAVESCAAPVPSEASIPLWQFVALVSLFVAGALGIVFGLSVGKKLFSFSGAMLHGSHIVVLGAFMVFVAAWVYASGPGFNFKTGFFEKNQHVHADLKVYVMGAAVNFSQGRFQNSNENPLSEFIHFEYGNGNAVHLHASGVPLSYLFSTFGGVLNKTCLQVASSMPLYCSAGANSLRFYVNGNWNADPESYQLTDLDQLLISYGPADENVSALLQSVTAEACILSGKCPVPAGYDLHEEGCAA